MKKELTLEEVERRIKSFEGMQSWMLEADEKKELRELIKRREELKK